MSALPQLSDGLAKLRELFHGLDQPMNADDVLHIDGQSARTICLILSNLHAMAVDQEIELQCLRDMEAGRDIRRTAETLSSEQISNLLGDADGNVIRPDFGGPKAGWAIICASLAGWAGGVATLTGGGNGGAAAACGACGASAAASGDWTIIGSRYGAGARGSAAHRRGYTVQSQFHGLADDIAKLRAPRGRSCGERSSLGLARQTIVTAYKFWRKADPEYHIAE